MFQLSSNVTKYTLFEIENKHFEQKQHGQFHFTTEADEEHRLLSKLTTNFLDKTREWT